MKITGVKMVQGATPRRGRLLVAHFDCELPGIELKGCSLFLLSNGHSFIQPPLMDGPARKVRAVSITDPELRTAMREAATEAYEALGGRMEWPEMANA